MYKILKISRLKKPKQLRVRHIEQGFSLMELLISTSITVAIIGMSLQLLNQSQTLFQKQSGRISAQSRARKAINLITSDVRATGLMPVGVSIGLVSGVAEGCSNRIRMLGDRKGDGSINNNGSGNNSNDDITYSVADRKLRRYAPNDPEFGDAVMAENISKLEFKFYDKSSNLLPFDDTLTNPTIGPQLSVANRKIVARIDVIITMDIIEGKTITGSVTLESPIALRQRVMDGY